MLILRDRCHILTHIQLEFNSTMPIVFISGYTKCNWPLSADPYIRIKHKQSFSFSVQYLWCTHATDIVHAPVKHSSAARPVQTIPYTWKLLLRELVDK